MERAIFGTIGAGFVGESFRLTQRQRREGSATNTTQRNVVVLPAWLRHGTQPLYWSETWLRKERLADWDRVAGTVYEADSMDDVIAHLHRAADAAQAE